MSVTLKICWLIISKVLWHTVDIILCMYFDLLYSCYFIICYEFILESIGSIYAFLPADIKTQPE